MSIPVLAYAATAVPATMDGGGVLFDDKDPVYVATLMDAILSDRKLEAAIVERQDAALGRLKAKDFRGTLLRAVESALVTPRLGHGHVAFDFWEQFDAAEALEALRLDRPSLGKALPTLGAPAPGAPSMRAPLGRS